MLPPDPDCVAGYLVAGSAKIRKAGYRDEYVRLHDVDGSAQLHVTPKELLLTALTGYLPGGGVAEGELRISNWLGAVPPEVAASRDDEGGSDDGEQDGRDRGGEASGDGLVAGASGATGSCVSDGEELRRFRCGRLWM